MTIDKTIDKNEKLYTDSKQQTKRDREGHNNHHNHNNYTNHQEEESGSTNNKPIFDFNEIKVKNLKSLQEYAKKINIHTSNIGNRELLVCDVMRHLYADYALKITGVLEMIENNNYGFLRYEENSYLNSKYDIYISPQLIHKYGLRKSDEITGMIVNKNQQTDKFFAMEKILDVSGVSPQQSKNRDVFEYLTATYPEQQIPMEDMKNTSAGNNMMRLVDIIAPIGRGQRMLIVAPPKTGKTTLEQQIAQRITRIKDLKLIVLLVDERPEEVTEMKKIVPNAIVISSTFDQPPEKHIQVSEMVFERAKRIAENKQHVVIVMDSLTRLVRAYNNQMPSSGKVLSGGFDAAAIQKGKSFLGIARNLQEGGSITIIGTALKNTGSKGDDVVYEELKSTGNGEIELKRELAQKQVFPAISFGESSTREVQRIIKDDNLMRKMRILWNMMHTTMNPDEAIVWLLNMIKSTPNNSTLFEQMTTMNNFSSSKK